MSDMNSRSQRAKSLPKCDFTSIVLVCETRNLEGGDGGGDQPRFRQCLDGR